MPDNLSVELLAVQSQMARKKIELHARCGEPLEVVSTIWLKVAKMVLQRN